MEWIVVVVGLDHRLIIIDSRLASSRRLLYHHRPDSCLASSLYFKNLYSEDSSFELDFSLSDTVGSLLFRLGGADVTVVGGEPTLIASDDLGSKTVR